MKNNLKEFIPLWKLIKEEKISKPITKEESKEKKEVSLKEIDDKFMTIDDFLDNFD